MLPAREPGLFISRKEAKHTKTLQTPSLNRITPLSPTRDNTVTFTYTDNQSVKNRAVITNNSTGDIIYDKIQETRTLTHIIPAATLTAGEVYLIKIQVFDIDGNSSNLSEPVLFYCFSAPGFSFHNLPDKSVTNHANISLSIDYSQAEGEELRDVQFIKYAGDKTPLAKSDVIYSQNPSYAFYALENNTTYYFRAIGETNHGISLDTGFIEVSTQFETIPTNIIFTLDNIYREGYIQFTSNIIVVLYELENDNYKIEDGLLTLSNNSLTYSGFSAGEDFILFAEAKKLPLGKPFLTTNDNNLSLSIIEVCGKYYCKLTVKDSNYSLYAPFPSLILSTHDGSPVITEDGKYLELISATYNDEDLLVFELKRKDGCYGLRVYPKSDKALCEEVQ